MSPLKKTIDKATSSASLFRVAYLGPLGTYSHEAALKRFSGPLYQFLPYQSIRDVIHALLPNQQQNTLVEWAVVPIENSTFGPVSETHQVLSEPEVIKNLKILKERIYLKIEHCLVGHLPKKLTDLSENQNSQTVLKRKIASHAQGLGQCQKYLNQHYPNAELIMTPSTAQAAALVAEDESGVTLAICSAACAQYFTNIEILDSSIQDDKKDNVTTFIILRSLNGDDDTEKFKAEKYKADN
ncbi:hypothetical protein O181_048122 [Austropuccinia psidii MF-1]|uniref:Prephenate dehydratase domain-containing protein n=1 Tax=Austropuccinia psidii MF-1 TaxID=1389203 RepID=A0A9Q3HLB5_9BASI|nr:hypothetical protein [Austropuccinia psidii MF-1]